MRAVIFGLLVMAIPGRCQIGGALETTQILNKLSLYAQYSRMGLQLAESIKQTVNMVKNTNGMSAFAFANIAAQLAQLAVAVQYGRGLAYSMGNVDSQFRATYPGYQAYTTPGSAGYYDQYRAWSATALDTFSGTLRAAAMQGGMLTADQTLINQVRNMLMLAGGRMQGIQVAAMMADQQAGQMQALRQIMLADLQSKQAYQGMMIQREATMEATEEQFFKYNVKPLDHTSFTGN